MYGKFYESYKQFVEEIQTRKLVFFCAGWRCLEVIHQYYRFPYEEIAFICDNMPEKWGGSVYNVPVCSPDKLLENPERYVVLIAVNDNFALKRIMQQLEEMGVPHYYSAAILNFANMIERYDTEGRRKYHEFNTFQRIEENMEKIQRVRGMLSDRKSVEIYDQYIEKVKYNVRDYSDIADDLYEHYFSDGIFKYGNDEVFVDGGAFDGDDTIWLASELRRQEIKLKKSLCFEPDAFNFGKTLCNLEKHYGVEAKLNTRQDMAESECFSVYRAGLYNENKGISFCEYGAHSSRFTEEDMGISVAAVKLDDVAKGEEITFIKYDLEGADIAALHGAEETIKRCRPKLALSIYHEIDDLWDIPLLVKEYVPEYKLFIRHHTVYLWDKVLYAMVEE